MTALHRRRVFVPLIAFTAVGVLIAAVPLDVRRVASDSMRPTLIAGDWVVIRTAVGEAHRGSIVVLELHQATPHSPLAADASGDMALLVKRVVGVAGDTLQMRQGQLYRNGAPADSGRPLLLAAVADQASPSFAWQKRIALRGSRFGDPPVEPSRDNWGPLIVPRDDVFVLGDNRMHSRDSRYFGFVSARSTIGTPLYVYFSVVPNSGIFSAVRWRRVGHEVR